MSAVNPTSTNQINGKTVQGKGVLTRLALVVPFILSAALHLSAVFKVFAALPIAYVFVKFGRLAGFVACAINMAIVWALLGRIDAAWFFVVAVVFGATLAESIKLRLKVEWIVVTCISMMLLSAIILFTTYAHKKGSGPVAIVQSFVNSEVDEFVRNAQKYKETTSLSTQDLEKIIIDPEVTKRNVLESAPSVILISLLLMVVSNLVLFLRFNVNNVRRSLTLKADFFRRWKTPDHLVWAALGAGFCLVVEIPVLTEIAMNVFRVLMAIYAIHGLAILSAYLHIWRVRTTLRPLLYILAITFLLPLIISLGFFDLWFNFRERLNINYKV